MPFVLLSLLMGIVALVTPDLRAETNAVVTVPVADVWSRPLVPGETPKDELRETQVLLGERVIVHELSGVWAYIEAVEQPTFRQHNRWEGYPGWVNNKALGYKNAPARQMGDLANGPVDIMSFAQEMIGTPYLWGGLYKSQGFDCSGLVHLAYRMHGIQIPRDAHEQWMKATPITRAELKPADLIFSAKVDHPKIITHVALYAGDGQIIEAPQTGMPVRKISFKEKYGEDLSQVESGQTVGDRVIYFGRFIR